MFTPILRASEGVSFNKLQNSIPKERKPAQLPTPDSLGKLPADFLRMYAFPWYIYALLGLNFLISAALGVVSLFLAFWSVKLLQAAVRALDRWQPTKPPTSYSTQYPQPAVPRSDDSRYQPKG